MIDDPSRPRIRRRCPVCPWTTCDGRLGPSCGTPYRSGSSATHRPVRGPGGAELPHLRQRQRHPAPERSRHGRRDPDGVPADHGARGPVGRIDIGPRRRRSRPADHEARRFTPGRLCWCRGRVRRSRRSSTATLVTRLGLSPIIVTLGMLTAVRGIALLLAPSSIYAFFPDRLRGDLIHRGARYPVFRDSGRGDRRRLERSSSRGRPLDGTPSRSA